MDEFVQNPNVMTGTVDNTMSEGRAGQNTNVGFVQGIDMSDGSVKDTSVFEGEEINAHISNGREDLEKNIGTADITIRSTGCIGGSIESDDAREIPIEGDDGSAKVTPDASLSKNTALGGSHAMETTESSQSKPKVGMVFHSEEEAYNFYNTYAKRRGFSVRKGHLSRRRDNSIRDRHYVCSNEGTRQEHRTHVTKKPRPLERTNCLARIEFKVNRSNVWVLHKFVDEHNHPLATANKIHLLRSHRKKMPLERAVFTAADYYFGAKPAQMHDNQAKDICNLENAGFLKKNQPTCLSIKRTRDLEKGDTQFLLEYLKTKQSEDPSFFYAVQLDEKEKLTNFFWADGRSINDYFHFGDTLTFDTTYRASKFDIPFALFIGVNHHKQIIIFGGALLLDDSTETFTWLFRTFLSAMSGKQPKTILTDCFDAISDAISMILPNACHRICLWHILQSIPKNIHSVSSRETSFQKDFENFIFGVSSEEDFHKSWDNLISKLPTSSGSWMKDLYAVRGKWALPYIGNTFVATMATKQWTESMENLFKIYFYRKLPLPKFISQYFNSLIKFREKELLEDYESRQSKQVLLVDIPMLAEAASSYTRMIYSDFEYEYKSQLACLCETIAMNGTMCTFRVTIPQKQSIGIVEFNPSNVMITCSCKKFETTGILCMHALKVLNNNNILYLPNQYIIKRWTKFATDGSTYCGPRLMSAFAQGPLTLQYSRVCHKAVAIAVKTALSKNGLDVLEHGLDKIITQIENIFHGTPWNKQTDGVDVVDDMQPNALDTSSLCFDSFEFATR